MTVELEEILDLKQRIKEKHEDSIKKMAKMEAADKHVVELQDTIRKKFGIEPTKEEMDAKIEGLEMEIKQGVAKITKQLDDAEKEEE